MALVKFGGGVAALAGKTGGVVYSRNKAGPFQRAWAMPTNTPTAAQTAQRANFALVSAAWRDASQHSKEDWDSWASGLTELNRLGEEYIPTGRQMFMQLNNNLTLCSATLITDPPVGETPPTLDSGVVLVASQTAGVLDVMSLSNTVASTNTILSVFGSPQVTGGKTNMATTYRLIGAFSPLDPVDILAGYITIFGDTGILDAMVRVKMRVINGLTGLSSNFQIVAVQVTTT